MALLYFLGTVVAVALMAPMVEGTTTQSQLPSTEVNILFPALDGTNMDNLDGSVVNVDASTTTILIDCRSSATAQCSSSGYILPQTLTAGPSFQDYYYDVTSYYNRTIYIVTGSLDCNMTSSTLGASCYTSMSNWVSSGTNSNSTAWSTTVSISSFNLKYNTLTVSSGLEKLQATATAATNASPGQTMTSTSTPTTTTASTLANNSSSKAWIAGPVIGAVVGLALVAAVAFWCVGKRRRSKADPVGWNPTEGRSEVSGHQVFLPVQNVQPSEISAKGEISELSTQNNYP